MSPFSMKLGMTNTAVGSHKGKHDFLLGISSKDIHQICLIYFFSSCDTKYLEACV